MTPDERRFLLDALEQSRLSFGSLSHRDEDELLRSFRRDLDAEAAPDAVEAAAKAFCISIGIEPDSKNLFDCQKGWIERWHQFEPHIAAALTAGGIKVAADAERPTSGVFDYAAIEQEARMRHDQATKSTAAAITPDMRTLEYWTARAADANAASVAESRLKEVEAERDSWKDRANTFERESKRWAMQSVIDVQSAERALAEAAAIEREACAKIFDDEVAKLEKQIEDNIAYSRRSKGHDDLWCASNELCRSAIYRAKEAARTIRVRQSAPAGDGWSSIDSAPRDGTRILAVSLHNRRIVIVEWSASAALWCEGSAWNSTGYGTGDLAEWRQLPAPSLPQAGERKDG